MSIFDKTRDFSREGGSGEVLLGEQALKICTRDAASIFHVFIDPLPLEPINMI